MARQIITHLVDDLDGTPATETVELEFNGDRYSIDLSDGNATHLREFLAPYFAGARRGKAKRGGRRYPSDPRSGAIREWARSQGMAVSEAGRLSKALVAAYNAAH